MNPIDPGQYLAPTYFHVSFQDLEDSSLFTIISVFIERIILLNDSELSTISDEEALSLMKEIHAGNVNNICI